MRTLLPLALLLGLPLFASAQSSPDSLATAAAAPLALDTTAHARPVAATQLPLDSVTALMTAPDTALALLQPLSAPERYALGRANAKHDYHPPKGTFWIGMGTGFVAPTLLLPAPFPLGLVGSAGSAVAIGMVKPKPERLQASAQRPALLRDADYQKGYAHQARNKKLGRTMAGWGVGTALWVGALVITLAALLSGGFS
ncbi:hypothetical protein [Hymenobacter jeollabukensis]|uniref:Uncharacterized protein n=1 Tax=Hymenobacter jeollabukensis TaxID=2025313 RepID=A0A5R8WSD2_9BACT|nr:hypothetical protein [Hymenobacter jeollabukensis]TLM94062.1 hypothetical protein FDY95_08525 [Hymenobacter jeollabukensis]